MLGTCFDGNQGQNSELVWSLIQPIQKQQRRRMNPLVPSKAKHAVLTDVKELSFPDTKQLL